MEGREGKGREGEERGEEKRPTSEHIAFLSEQNCGSPRKE